MADEGGALNVGDVEAVLRLRDEFSEVARKFIESAKEVIPGLEAIGIGVGIVTAAIAAGIAVIMLLGTHGSEVDDVTKSFQRLSGGAETANATLASLRAGVVGTVSDLDLMKDANKLLASGVHITSEQFGTLAEASRLLAHEGFGETKTNLEQLSLAMETGRLRGEIIKQLHIDLKQAEDQYAHSIGTTAEELSGQGKAHAVAAALMDALKKKVSEAGEQELTFAEEVAQVKTNITNFVNALAVAVAQSPVVKVALDAIAGAFNAAFGGDQAALVVTLIGYVNQFAIIVVSMGIGTVQAVNVAYAAWSLLRSGILFVETGIVGVIAMLARLAAAVPGVGAALKDTAADLTNMREGLALETHEAMLGVEGHSQFNETLDKVGGTLYNLRDRMQEASTKTADHKAITDALAQTQSHAGDIADVYRKDIDNVNSSMTTLSGAQIEAIKYYLREGDSVEEITKILKVYAHQVEQVATNVKLTSELRKIEIGEIAANKDALSGLAEMGKKQQEQFAQNGVDEIGGLKNNIAIIEQMQNLHNDYVSKSTQSTFDYQRDQTAAWASDEESQIDYSAANWVESFNRIEQSAKDKYAAITIAEHDAFGVMQAQEISWGNGFRDIIDGFPNLLKQAFTGGGGLSGALSAGLAGIGQTIGKNVFEGPNGIGQVVAEHLSGSGLSSSMSGLLGNAVGGLATAGLSLAAPLVMKGIAALIHIGGPSQAELAGRDTVAQFEQQMGGWQGIQQALLGTGMAADQVNAKIQALWASEKSGGAAAKAQIDSINQAMNDQQQDTQDAQAAMQKYGLTIEDMGPKFKQQNLDGQAQQLINEWRVLVDAGAEVVTVDDHMASSINAYLQLARKTGAEVPQSMQPILQTMIDQGDLLDDNGNKITDMKQVGVSFSETMTQGFQKIVDKLDALLQRIGVDLPAAISKVPTQRTIDIDFHGTQSGYAPEGGPGLPTFGPEVFVPSPRAAIVGTNGGEVVLHKDTYDALRGGGGNAAVLQELRGIRAGLALLPSTILSGQQYAALIGNA